MSVRGAALLMALAAAAALATAYYAQFVLRLTPCELCLWERWPYRAVLVLGLIATVFPYRSLLAAAALALAAGAGIAFFHVGVELHYWPSPLPECNGILVPGAPLPLIPARPCDEPVRLIPFLPISMAWMDFLYEAAFAFAVGAYLFAIRRRMT